MKRAAAAALCAALGAGGAAAPTKAAAAERDDWFGRDKALHFGASFVIAQAGYGTAALATPARSPRLIFGGVLALAAGVGKELLDATGRGDASWRDLTWDAAGTATGLAIAWTIDRLVFGPRPSSSSSRPTSVYAVPVVVPATPFEPFRPQPLPGRL